MEGFEYFNHVIVSFFVYLPVPDDATVNVLLVSLLSLKILFRHDKLMHIR